METHRDFALPDLRVSTYTEYRSDFSFYFSEIGIIFTRDTRVTVMAVTLKAELPAHDEVNVTDSGNNDK